MLKEEVLRVERMHKEELSEALEELEMVKLQTVQNIRIEEQLEEAAERDRSSAELREQLGRKKELIRGLKEREKGLVQIIEDIREHAEKVSKPKKSK